MGEQRLLERIGFFEKHPDRRGTSDPAMMTVSIIRHLQRILNTKQGSAQISDDYGLPDFSTLKGSSSSESIKELERSIKEVIQKYEPRLTMVKVIAEPKGDDLLSLYFKIEARLALEKMDIPVMFETVLNSDGRMSIRQ